jgi:hypothetical protein
MQRASWDEGFGAEHLVHGGQGPGAMTTSSPSSNVKPRSTRSASRARTTVLFLRRAVPQPDRLFGAVGGDGQRDDDAAIGQVLKEIALAMADIAEAAREGLLAMSVAGGMAVMAAMFEAEITEACGAKGKHDAKRAVVRHGYGGGSVTLGGRRVR